MLIFNSVILKNIFKEQLQNLRSKAVLNFRRVGAGEILRGEATRVEQRDRERVAERERGGGALRWGRDSADRLLPPSPASRITDYAASALKNEHAAGILRPVPGD